MRKNNRNRFFKGDPKYNRSIYPKQKPLPTLNERFTEAPILAETFTTIRLPDGTCQGAPTNRSY